METTARVSALAQTFSGDLLQAGDPGYDTIRRVHNGLIDKRPALIARCRGVADIVDAVTFARDQGLEVAVRGGGHNVAGRSTVDSGLLVDLSLMQAVHVDPGARVARAQGGVTWNLFNRETQLHGLATTGGVVSSTGIAGLTLGGGVGWLMGKHGLALDNLLSVDLVLADGRTLTATKEETPDLFWALQGGGGNFGVASSFTYRLHAVGPDITGGIILYPFSEAWDVLRFYRDVTASLPDEFIVFAGLVHAPDGSGEKFAALVVCHCGSLDAGARAAKRMKQFSKPVLDAIGTMTYCQINAMLDGAYPRGALNYWKSSFLSGLSDEAIRTMIECFGSCPTPMGQLLLENFHGAVTRVGTSETAFPHRAEGHNLLVLAEWIDPDDNGRCIAWARDAYSAMQPYMGANRYVNYLGEDETAEATASAYGPNYRRLQAVKARFDPDNVFHMNQNIVPSA